MDPESKRAAFINGLIVAHADGVSDPRERTVLWQFKDRAGISDADAVAWSEGVRRGEMTVQAVHRTGDALAMIELLALVAVADGEVSEPERDAICAVGNACGLSAYSMREITARIWKP